LATETITAQGDLKNNKRSEICKFNSSRGGEGEYCHIKGMAVFVGSFDENYLDIIRSCFVDIASTFLPLLRGNTTH